MKNLMLLSLLALASCAPTVMVEQPTTDQRTYSATCVQALDAVAAAAPRITPASLGGLGGWGAFEPVDRQASILRTVSRSAPSSIIVSGIVSTQQSTTSITWSCTEASGRATLNASSTGQARSYAQAALDAFWKTITLPA